MATELHEELADGRVRRRPGDLGENILTAGIDLLDAAYRGRD